MDTQARGRLTSDQNIEAQSSLFISLFTWLQTYQAKCLRRLGAAQQSLALGTLLPRSCPTAALWAQNVTCKRVLISKPNRSYSETAAELLS